MSFYYSVSRAITASNTALSQLYSYNSYQDPSTQPNVQIRQNARDQLKPAWTDLDNAVANSRYEGIRRSDVNEAARGARFISAAHENLRDLIGYHRANVSQAVSQIRSALNALYNAQY